jgi:hypothetical protein
MQEDEMRWREAPKVDAHDVNLVAFSAFADPGTFAAAASVKNDADFDALPSGTEFVGPDGQLRRKA